eukprot:m.4369 g.4369  ORF g.4369 m.4369 type:complete len:1010 (+) comp2219_c0_seq1:163-3192(+)
MFTQFSSRDFVNMDDHDERAVVLALLKLSSDSEKYQQEQQLQQQVPSSNSTSSHHPPSSHHHYRRQDQHHVMVVPSSSMGQSFGQFQHNQNQPHCTSTTSTPHIFSSATSGTGKKSNPFTLSADSVQRKRSSTTSSSMDVVTRPCSPDVSSPDCDDESMNYQNSLHRLQSFPPQSIFATHASIYPPCHRCIKGGDEDDFYWRICSRKCMDVFMEEKGVNAFLDVNKNCVPVGINSHELNFFPVGTGKPIYVAETEFPICLMRPKYVPGEVVILDHQGLVTACQVQFVLWSGDGDVLYVISKFSPKKRFKALLSRYASLKRQNKVITHDQVLRIVNAARDEQCLTSSSEDEHDSMDDAKQQLDEDEDEGGGDHEEDDDEEELEEEEEEEEKMKEDADDEGNESEEKFKPNEVTISMIKIPNKNALHNYEPHAQVQPQEYQSQEHHQHQPQPQAYHQHQPQPQPQPQQHQPQPQPDPVKKPPSMKKESKASLEASVSNATDWFDFYSKTGITLPNLMREGIAMDVVNIKGKDVHQYRFKSEKELSSDTSYDPAEVTIASQGGPKLGFQNAKELRDKCKKYITLENGHRTVRVDYDQMVDNLILAPLDLIVCGKKRHVCACGRLWANGQQLGGHRGKCQAYRPTNREFKDVFLTMKKMVEISDHEQKPILDVEHRAVWDALLNLYHETESVAKEAQDVQRRRAISKHCRPKSASRRRPARPISSTHISIKLSPSSAANINPDPSQYPLYHTGGPHRQEEQYTSPPRSHPSNATAPPHVIKVQQHALHQHISPSNPYVNAALTNPQHPTVQAFMAQHNATTDPIAIPIVSSAPSPSSNISHATSLGFDTNLYGRGKRNNSTASSSSGSELLKKRRKKATFKRRTGSRRRLRTKFSAFVNAGISNKEMERYCIELLRAIYEVEAVDEFFSIVHEAQPQYEDIFRQRGKLVAKLLFRSPPSVISSIRCGRFGATETAKDVFRAAYDVSYVRRSDKRRYVPALQRRSRFLRTHRYY